MSGHKAYKCNCKQLIFLFFKFMCVNICVYVFILVHMLFPAHAHPRSSGSCTGKRWFVLQEEVQCVCVFISVWVFVRLGGEPQLRGLAPYCKLHSRWRGQRLSSLLLTSPAAPLLAPAISALNYCTYSACIEEHQLQFLSRCIHSAMNLIKQDLCPTQKAATRIQYQHAHVYLFVLHRFSFIISQSFRDCTGLY